MATTTKALLLTSISGCCQASPTATTKSNKSDSCRHSESYQEKSKTSKILSTFDWEFLKCGYFGSVIPWKLAVLLLLSSACLKLSNGAALHHKEYRSAGLFALNNFTDLYDASSASAAVSSSSSSSAAYSSPSSASSIKSMDLTSVEQNDVNIPDYDSPLSSSRNLQLDTKQNSGKSR